MPTKILPLLLCALIALVALSSCSTAAQCRDPQNPGSTDAKCKVIKPAAECLEGDIPAIVATFAPIVRDVIKMFTGADGTVDWNSFENMTLSLVGDYGQCVIASVFDDFLSGAMKLAPGEVNPRPDVVRAEWVKLKVTRYNGRAATTKRGVM